MHIRDVIERQKVKSHPILLRDRVWEHTSPEGKAWEVATPPSRISTAPSANHREGAFRRQGESGEGGVSCPLVGKVSAELSRRGWGEFGNLQSVKELAFCS